MSVRPNAITSCTQSSLLKLRSLLEMAFFLLADSLEFIRTVLIFLGHFRLFNLTNPSPKLLFFLKNFNSQQVQQVNRVKAVQLVPSPVQRDYWRLFDALYEYFIRMLGYLLSCFLVHFLAVEFALSCWRPERCLEKIR